jgi:hypothetical protein
MKTPIRKPKFLSEDADGLIRVMRVLSTPRKTKFVGIKVPEELHALLKRLAEVNETTITDILITGAIKQAEEYFKNYEGPIPSKWFDLFPQYFGKKF